MGPNPDFRVDFIKMSLKQLIAFSTFFLGIFLMIIAERVDIVFGEARI